MTCETRIHVCQIALQSGVSEAEKLLEHEVGSAGPGILAGAVCDVLHVLGSCYICRKQLMDKAMS